MQLLKARKWLIALTLTPITIIIDQFTQFQVIERFQLGESLNIIPNYLNFTYVRNTGAAFGAFSQSHAAFRIPFFLIVPLIALIVISILFKRLPSNNTKLSLALSLVMGGAIGNLLDRARFQYVIDFLDFHWKNSWHFATFNIADSAICIGVGILLLDIITTKESSSHASSSF